MALSADGTTLAIGAFGEDSNGVGIDPDAQADNSVAASGAVYVFVRSGATWVQQAYLKASNAEADDEFGLNVALSADGSTLAVGARGEDSSGTGVNSAMQADDSAESSGAVYVFTRSGNGWSQQAYIKASNTDAGDMFGTALALSGDGDTLAAGAWHESSNGTGVNGNAQADNSLGPSGATYVFTRSGNKWAQQAYIKSSNPDLWDGFGGALALSSDGNLLAVGASGESSNGTGVDSNTQADDSKNWSGAVYLFVRAGNTWSQQNYLKASNTDWDDGFGRALALSSDGTTLAVGASSEDSYGGGIDSEFSDDNTMVGSGAVYVFVKSAGVWSQRAFVKASHPGISDVFGASVALSADGSLLAVGAPGEGSNGTGVNSDTEYNNSQLDSGAVYVYSRNGESFAQLAYVKASNSDASDVFGTVAVSASGDTIVVGAWGEASSGTGVNSAAQSDDSAYYSGAVYVFE
jgi:hypothetical protein